MAKEGDTRELNINELRAKGVALARSKKIKTPAADALLDFQTWSGWANARRAQLRADAKTNQDPDYSI